MSSFILLFVCIANAEAMIRHQIKDCNFNGGECVLKTSLRFCAKLHHICPAENICCINLRKKKHFSHIKDFKIATRKLCKKTSKRCRQRAGKCIAVKAVSKCKGRTDDSLCNKKSCTCCFKGCQCGQANKLRIVGGKPVKPKNKYPWMVALSSRSKASVYYCGGSLINDRYVLTAAHCLYLSYPLALAVKDIKVTLADHNQMSTNDDVPGVTRTVAIGSYKVHENYNAHTNDDDIALIKLKKPLDLRAYKQIKPICLPTNPDETYEGVDATVAGWGLQNYSHDNSIPAVPHEVTIPILSTECKGNTGFYDITGNMLCAGLPQGGKDVCSGDSGGPLFVNEKGTFTVVGIVSFGMACGEPDTPGVYTRVTGYLDWIKKNTLDAVYC